MKQKPLNIWAQAIILQCDEKIKAEKHIIDRPVNLNLIAEGFAILKQFRKDQVK